MQFATTAGKAKLLGAALARITVALIAGCIQTEPVQSRRLLVLILFRFRMQEDTLTLVELILHADQFCASVETHATGASKREKEELRLKIGQCRSLLAELQKRYNDDQLSIHSTFVRAQFRNLVMSLLWAAFYGRRFIDAKMFRMLVRIESGFTDLMVLETGRRSTQSE